MAFTYYHSGVEIKQGDRITYHGDPGRVEFVITGTTGDPAMDWFLEDSPEGGVGIVAERFGSVFLRGEGIPEDEDLEFVSRAPNASR